MGGLFILIAALYFPRWYGRKEGEGDARKIFRNGSADSLKEIWHRNNLIRRLVLIGGASVVLFVLMRWLLDFNWWFLPAYFNYAWWLCFYTFTPTLNLCRKLPAWYVSRDARASETDKAIVRWAAKFGLEPEQLSWLLHTGLLVVGFLILAVVIVQNFR